jgi:hypothetical protein
MQLFASNNLSEILDDSLDSFKGGAVMFDLPIAKVSLVKSLTRQLLVTG